MHPNNTYIKKTMPIDMDMVITATTKKDVTKHPASKMTNAHHDDDDLEPTTSCQVDTKRLRELYSFPRGIIKTDSARSLSSCATASSTLTDNMSNTTVFHKQEVERKEKFQGFVKVLFRFLECCDPVIYAKAKTVVPNNDDSFLLNHSDISTAKSTLKKIVGKTYWKEAQRRNEWRLKALETADDLEPLSLSDTCPTSFCPDDMIQITDVIGQGSSPLQDCSNYQNMGHMSITSAVQHVRTSAAKRDKKRVRKTRTWMMIRVLMKYLEHNDHQLFERAKMTIRDCSRRNKDREVGFRNLTVAVRESVRELVGEYYWSTGERYFMQLLSQKQSASSFASPPSSPPLRPSSFDQHARCISA